MRERPRLRFGVRQPSAALQRQWGTLTINIACHMSDPKRRLLEVLCESRALLALPNNDFAWSTWDNTASALSELDSFITAIEDGTSFESSALSILFATTGDIQEVSMSSGWGDEFLRVAERFDSALAQFKAKPTDERSEA
jgi:hypothetical protein